MFVSKIVWRYDGCDHLCQWINSERYCNWLFGVADVYCYHSSGHVVFERLHFVPTGHAQLCHLCHLIQKDKIYYHSPTCVYCIFVFQLFFNFGDCLSCSIVNFLCGFLSVMWLSIWMICPVIRPSIVRVLIYPYHSTDPRRSLSEILIQFFKNCRQLL